MVSTFDYIGLLGLSDLFLGSLAVLVCIGILRFFLGFVYGTADDVAASTIHNSTVMFSNISISTDSDDDEWEPEPTPAPAQPFTACQKCGAPRTSHTCEYCGQTLF